MRILLSICAFLLASTSFACGNEYGHSLDGERVFTKYFYLAKRHREFDKEEIRRALNKKLALEVSTYKDDSDIALYYMKLGKNDKALKILEALAKDHPNEYIIIANLGTSYELDGQLEKALEMIKEGYKLNPDSHLGSEWIHIKILEAKIKEKSRPGWIANHPIIDIEDLKKTIGDRRHRFRDNHLEFQIRTRVAFTPPPNQVIANLCKSLAKYNEEYGSYENAILAYTYQLEFTESNYRRRQISSDIQALNKRRRESGITELNFMFTRLIESGEIDPMMMLYGVDDLAEQLHEEDEKTFLTRDSIRMLQAQVDSLSNVQGEKSEERIKRESAAPGTLWGILFGVIGLVLGLVTAFVAMKRRKMS